MDSNAKIKQLTDEIEQLQNWIVDHPEATYLAKQEVLYKWGKKHEELQNVLRAELNKPKNTFKIN